MNFGVKNFIVRNDSKKNKKLAFECYNLVDPMEWGECYFLRLMSNKVAFRSYCCFPCISDLTSYRQKKSKHNMQNVGFLAKCGCIMYTTIVYQWTTDILVCLVCQKLANCA
jgi:hypothetical protein